MNDTTTNQPLHISTDGTAGPYIMTPVSQLAELRRALDEGHIPYTVEHNAISLDGRPEVAIVDLGRDADVDAVRIVLANAR
jgi:hypothetical protein